MFALSPQARAKAMTAYAANKAFFPLIAAVLSGAQRGTIYGDAADTPRQIYVEHAFGFAQLFGESASGFEAALQSYLLEDKAFAAPKVRLYTPLLPPFHAAEAMRAARSERQRFFLRAEAYAAARRRILPGTESRAAWCVTAENAARVENAFGLMSRFWPDAAAFVEHARAHVVCHEGEPAAICYAAALENGKAEVDILTLPACRGKGLAMLAAMRFMDDCLEHGLEPLWDCFTNNVASMTLRERLGFLDCAAPYEFFTIAR